MKLQMRERSSSASQRCWPTLPTAAGICRSAVWARASLRMASVACGWFAIVAVLLAGGPAVAANPKHRGLIGTFVSTPEVIVSRSGESAEGERGLFFVPENRANPASRVIAIQFLRFRSLDATVASEKKPRAPVFLLAGGPGSEYDFTQQGLFRKLQRLRQSRDVVYVSQRGSPRAAGLVSPLWIRSVSSPLSEPRTTAVDRENQRRAVREAIAEWSARGVDLAGYDILNIVDDLHDLREALGYEKIALCGCSFGSQWSLAYIKRWPRTVERALLSGVEPLDYAYDSPQWLWESMSRVAHEAEADVRLTRYIPKGGLMEAIRALVVRFEQQPVTAQIVDPQDGKRVDVMLGVEDLRAFVASVGIFTGATKRDALAHWPRFIVELAGGDFRFLAALAWETRTRAPPDALIVPLIDNSLGITAARDAQLAAEPAARWLGDINAFYHNTRDIVPTPNVGDAFRADFPIGVPVLLMNGDFDWSTPIENAVHARRLLRSGHLITVKGGTHCTDNDEMPLLLPAAYEQVYGFFDAELGEPAALAEYFATLPDAVAFPAVDFEVPTGPSLYDQWLTRRGKR